MILSNILESKRYISPNKVAIVCEQKTLTYSQLDDRVNRLANAMISLGIKKNDRVAIACVNCSEYIEIIFACGKIGAVSTHLNWRSVPKQLGQISFEAEIKLLFLSYKFHDIYNGIREIIDENVKIVSVGNDLGNALIYENLIIENSPDKPKNPSTVDDVLIQFYTSGTTGTPKGVMLTNKSVIDHSLINIMDSGLLTSDTFIQVLPMFHAAGTGALNILICGGKLVIKDGFESREYCELIQKEKISVLGLVPNLLNVFVNYDDIDKYDLSSVRVITYGAAPIHPVLLKRLIDKFKCDFIQYFGMTETGPVIGVLRSEDHRLATQTPDNEWILSSVGRPATGGSFKIVDESGECLDHGQIGDILVKGPGVMCGYFKNPQLTEKVFKDGWYHTKDIGYIKNGYLFLVDRKDDMIISGGENIYPSEVENCILSLKDDIAQCVVIGIPSLKWGEVVCAIIVRKQGSDISKDEIMLFTKNQLATYKKPKKIVFVDEIPHNATGKISRKELKKRYNFLSE